MPGTDGEAKPFGGFPSQLPIEHDVVFADQDRNVKSECTDRIGYFSDIGRIGLAQPAPVRFEGIDGVELSI